MRVRSEGSPATAGAPVLVTGGAGYIGSHVCRALRAAGHLPVTVDDLSTGHAGAVRWGPLEVGDVADRRRLRDVLRRHQPVAVLHLAASAAVAASVRDPRTSYRDNLVASLALLDAAVDGPRVPVVLASTCAVYGRVAALPIPETADPRPVSPYGAAKLAVERALSDYEGAYGLRSVVLRCFNVAGAADDGALGEHHEPETHLVPRLLRAADGGSPPAELHGTDLATPDGTPVRDYVHVTDVADAHVRAVAHLLAGGDSVTCNVGSGSGASVREVAAVVEGVTGRRLPTVSRPARAGDPPAAVADIARARRVLGWRPDRSSLRTIVADAWAAQRISSRAPGRSGGRGRALRPQPTVSVVLPTRDRRALLAQTLRSVLEQRADLEVVVVDEGSSDGTAQLLDQLEDPRVRVVRHAAPRGLSQARNAGVAAATGRWVACVDDDDLWLPDKLERQVRAAEEAGTAWAYGGALTFSAGPVLHRVEVPPGWVAEHLRLPARNVVPGGGSNVVVRRAVLERAGGFDPTIPMVADWDLWIRLARVGPPAVVSHPLVAYRLHAGNMSHRLHEVLAGCRTLEERYAHLRAGRPFDWAAVHSWLWTRCLQAGDPAGARWCARQAMRRRHPGAIKQLVRASLPIGYRAPQPGRPQTASHWLDHWRPRGVATWPDGARDWLADLLATRPEDLLPAAPAAPATGPRPTGPRRGAVAGAS